MPESAKLGKSNKVRQSNLHFSKDSVVPEVRSETRDGRCRPAGKPGIGGIWAPSELSTFIKESYPWEIAQFRGCQTKEIDLMTDMMNSMGGMGLVWILVVVVLVLGVAALVKYLKK